MSRWSRAATLVSVFALAFLVTACGPSVSERHGLDPLPVVQVEPFERAVREQLTAARGALDAMLSAKPEDSELARAYGELGQRYQVYELWQAAEASYRNALRISPEDPRWLHYLAVVLQTTGQLDEAAERFRQVLSRRPDDLPARVRLGQTLFDHGNQQSARVELERALEIEPDCALAHYFLGRLALSEGNAATAVEHFDRALELQPRADRLHYHLAQAQRRLGNTARAERHARQVGSNEVWLEDPLNDALRSLEAGAAAHIRRAAAAQIDGHDEAAIEEYRKAVTADPDNPEARQGLGGMLAHQGDIEGAISQLEKALDLDPTSPRVHFNLGGLRGLRGELEVAFEHYDTTLRLDPRYDAAYLASARLMAEAGRLDPAEDRYRRLLELEPAHLDARLDLAALLARREQIAEAIAFLAETLELDLGDEERARVLGRQASFEGARGRVVDAEALWREAIELAPRRPGGHFGLASLLGAQGRYREAATAFRYAAEVDPEDRRIRLGETTALVLAGEWMQARARLEDALRVFDGDPELSLGLARVLATSPDDQARDGARALEIAQGIHATQSTLESAEILAMALAELGRFDEAAQWQRRVLSQLETLGRPDLSASAARRLEAYSKNRPIRGNS